MAKGSVVKGRTALRMVVLAAVVVAGLAVGQLAWAGPNPPGNNGTIKVDDEPFDDTPDNQPHVGCVFQVDFYGYDEGDLDATVTFEAHPPTGPVQPLLTDTVFIGEDDNGGGGSQAGLDASVTYTLDLSAIQPHPVQGIHVMLTINAEGSQGADVKHKVFWVTGCAALPTTTTIAPTTTAGPTTTTGATSTSGVTTTSGATSTSGATTTTAHVGGSSSSAPGSSLGSGGGVLPFTGGGGLPLLLGAAGLVGLGTASVLAGRRRRA